VLQIYIPLLIDENMRKKIILGIVGLFAVMFVMNFASAYYYTYPAYGGYGYDDQYDSYSYSSQRTTGNGPYVSTKSTNYNRVTENYWNGREWVKRTSYVSEKRESPQYSRGYGGYGNYYGGYNNYNRYNNYNPWYQKYWDNDRYNNYGYGNYNSYPNYGYGY
jgi:hypothetical protein